MTSSTGSSPQRIVWVNAITATYDAFRKLSLTDAKGNTTLYEYDRNNQLTK